MDIVERYVCGYIVECLTGQAGQNDVYYSVLSTTRSSTKHPLLKKVLEHVHGKDCQDESLKAEVKKMALEYIMTPVVEKA